MDTQNTEAQNLIMQAREALRRGDKEAARNLGEQAALLDPGMEDAWLILTATDPDPKEALAYAQQALEINPSSARALKAVEWAMARVKQSQAAETAPVPAAPVVTEKPPAEKKSDNRNFIFAAILLLFLICVAFAFSAYTGMKNPAFASMLKNLPLATQENLWAPMEIAKATVTSIDGGDSGQQAVGSPIARSTQEQSSASAATRPASSAGSATSESEASESLSTKEAGSETSKTPSAVLSDTPIPPLTQTPTAAVTATPQPTETPGTMSMQILEDTPTSQYVPPTLSAALPEVAASGNGARWIDVDLTNQRVYAYEGDVVVNSFIVSTGTRWTPTVTGQYKIYVKYRSGSMSGPGYYLPNVPYIMYFYKGYGLHGTYWHNNFGTPMSHGCVNLRTDEAGWLYNWASVGTLVNVHY